MRCFAPATMRFFQNRCGIPPHTWLKKIRMWKSLPRLRETRHVSEVAHELHFDRVSTFNEHFRDTFGCAPRQFIVNPEMILDNTVAKTPGIQDANGSNPMSELSSLARSTIEAIRSEKNATNVRNA